MSMQNVVRPDYGEMAEADLVRRAHAGERDAFRAIMQRGNQRLYRVARGIARDEAEAEDILQETYVRAFAAFDAFRGDSSVFTWLTRIVVNEANGRLRKRRNQVGLDQIEIEQGRGAHVIMFPNVDATANPEKDAARMQIRRLIERAVDDLPESFRTVFILRDIEGCSVAETASSLNLREETVKTRLHRARRQLRAALTESVAATIQDAFPFLGGRCERVTKTVLLRLDATRAAPDDPAA